MRILIGKKYCEDVRGFPGDRISEIDSYICRFINLLLKLR